MDSCSKLLCGGLLIRYDNYHFMEWYQTSAMKKLAYSAAAQIQRRLRDLESYDGRENENDPPRGQTSKS